MHPSHGLRYSGTTGKCGSGIELLFERLLATGRGVVERAGHSAKATRYSLAPTLLGDLGLGYTARTGLK